MFPSTTAALRCRPWSLARFIGEPLNAAENSSCVIASSSRASVRASRPAIAARGWNGESVASGVANRSFHGHTSWEICRLTHFEIALETGARAVRKETP